MVVRRATIPRPLNAVVPVGCASGFVPQAGQGREDSGRPLSNGQIAVAADAERQAESHIGVPLSRLGEQHGLALVHMEVGTWARRTADDADLLGVRVEGPLKLAGV